MTMPSANTMPSLSVSPADPSLSVLYSPISEFNAWHSSFDVTRVSIRSPVSDPHVILSRVHRHNPVPLYLTTFDAGWCCKYSVHFWYDTRLRRCSYDTSEPNPQMSNDRMVSVLYVGLQSGVSLSSHFSSQLSDRDLVHSQVLGVTVDVPGISLHLP